MTKSKYTLGTVSGEIRLIKDYLADPNISKRSEKIRSFAFSKLRCLINLRHNLLMAAKPTDIILYNPYKGLTHYAHSEEEANNYIKKDYLRVDTYNETGEAENEISKIQTHNGVTIRDFQHWVCPKICQKTGREQGTTAQ